MAAHLMTQRNILDLAPSRTREEGFGCCQGCKTMMLPGLTSTTSIESIAASRRKRHKSKHATTEQPTLGTKTCQKWIRVTCTTCHRYQKIELKLEKTARSSQRSSIPESSLQPMTPSSLPTSSRPVSLNQNSKQRAKARKQGLSTLLEKSKQSKAEAGHGLDLMDFMKETDATGR